jgi:starch synthase (maltosyl-transferring)
LISELNRIRRANPALQSHLGIRFYDIHDDQVLLYGKRLTSNGDMILVAVSLDPFNVHDCAFDLPLWEFGLPDDGAIRAADLMRDVTMTLRGKWQRTTLTPEAPFALWRIGVSHG